MKCLAQPERETFSTRQCSGYILTLTYQSQLGDNKLMKIEDTGKGKSQIHPHQIVCYQLPTSLSKHILLVVAYKLTISIHG